MIKSLSRRERGVGPPRGGTGWRQRVLGNSASRGVLALGCVLAGALLTAGPASAASRGYKLYNQSTRTLRVESATPLEAWLCDNQVLHVCLTNGFYALDFEGRPRDGQLLPGRALNGQLSAPQDWELKYGLTTSYGALLKYKILGTDGFVEYGILNKFYLLGLTNSTCKVVPSSVGHCTAGRDHLTFADNPQPRLGGPGNDTISGGHGDDRIFGGQGDDFISGGPGDDRISGGQGNDRISGGPGDDRISGGPGDDRISGGRGDDFIFGGRGDDFISGGRGDDFISGGPGNDTIHARDGHRDAVDCGPGRDVAFVDPVDLVRGCERVVR
jgi:hypothetical protein